MVNYRDKYIKYKAKYIALQTGGGFECNPRENLLNQFCKKMNGNGDYDTLDECIDGCMQKKREIDWIKKGRIPSRIPIRIPVDQVKQYYPKDFPVDQVKQVKLNDGKYYDPKDIQYYPKFNKRTTLSYSDFNESIIPYSFFIKDSHGSPEPYNILLNLLNNHNNIEVVYLECPPKSIKSESLTRFMAGEITIDAFFDKYVSSTVASIAIIAETLVEFEKAFKETFNTIAKKFVNEELDVKCIDDWGKTGKTDKSTDRFRRNYIMAKRIDTNKNSIFLCGGLHFETIFALQDHINPELLDIYLFEDS
jgi:hypothetical protein